MHIKQLTISGFKSYKDQVVIEPFSPGCNVVVGRNGSGKSNFFSAIRFVLNDAYSKLDSEERSALLYEGAGQPALSGFVEIVFDNADNRFPTGRDEVVLRRTIGLKKDEYSLDHKIITKTDVMNLLQSAGFSRSNPYYIVPQGRITALCNAKDGDRLALLKEVAGTRVYEEHRTESLKIMEETERKREKIVELLAMINERLSELEEERTELESFMEVDRERKACEYALWTKQLTDVNQSIDGLDHEEQEVLASLEENIKERSLIEAQLIQLQSIEQQLLEEKAQLEDSLREEEMARIERDELLKEITHLELTVSNKQQAIEGKAKVEARLNMIHNELVDCEQRFKVADADDIRLTSHLDDLKKDIDNLESQKSSLKAKKSRTSQFKTINERDKWIRQETAALNITLDLSRRQLNTLQEESRSANVKAADLRATFEEKQRADEDLRRSQADALAAYKSVKEKREEIVEARKEGWRAEAKLEQTIKSVSEEVERWERTLACSMDRACFLGLQCIQRIAMTCGVQDKLFGPVCELFTCDPVYRQAVETVAGNSLFNVVVEDEDTAVILMEALVKEKSGRLTFIPLSSVLKENIANLDAIDSSAFIPLIGKLDFDPKFTHVMAGIFGRALVVPELGLSSTSSRPADMDLVTLTGDRQSRKGVIVGGYVDLRRSRIEAISKLKEWRDRQQTCKQQLVAIRSKLSSLEQSLSQLTTQLHILERQQSAQQSATELDDVYRQLKGAEEMVNLKTRTINTVQQRIKVMIERITELESELGKPLLNNDDAIIDTTSTLDSELMQLLARFDQINTQRTVSSSHLNQLRSTIVGLKEERTALFDKLTELSKLASESTSLERLYLVLTQANNRLTSVGKSIDEHSDAVRRLEDAAEKSQNLITSHSGKSTPLMESFLSRRSHLLQQKEDCQKHLRDVGVVSEEVASKYMALLNNQLVEELHKCNDLLRQKFPHVNRRAREQHAQYTKQSEDLLSRKADLDASANSISEFIKSLDTKKDEAILRTFNQVSESFAIVFNELGGSGQLEIVRDESTDDFVGISVRIASFGGDNGNNNINDDSDSPSMEAHLLKQLSGGQKSVVALAIILAIQMVDPAPFYLFDEVDAALDAAHRTALARLLAKNKAHQYVITTFRPELVHIGDQHWGVTGGGAAGSRVDGISKDVALQFIEHI